MRTYANIEDFPGGGQKPLQPLALELLSLIGNATPGEFFTSHEAHTALAVNGTDYSVHAVGQSLKVLANRGHVVRFERKTPAQRVAYQVPVAI